MECRHRADYGLVRDTAATDGDTSDAVFYL